MDSINTVLLGVVAVLGTGALIIVAVGKLWQAGRELRRTARLPLPEDPEARSERIQREQRAEIEGLEECLRNTREAAIHAGVAVDDLPPWPTFKHKELAS